MYSKTREDSHRCFFSSSISRNSQPIKGTEHIGIIARKVGDVWNKIEISIYCSVRNASLENVKIESTRFRK